jgi:hypothetical protein
MQEVFHRFGIAEDFVYCFGIAGFEGPHDQARRFNAQAHLGTLGGPPGISGGKSSLARRATIARVNKTPATSVDAISVKISTHRAGLPIICAARDTATIRNKMEPLIKAPKLRSRGMEPPGKFSINRDK